MRAAQISRLFVWVVLAVLAIGRDAHAQTERSTRQMEGLSAHSANRQVQADLLSVLEPTPKIDSGMFRRLRGVELLTRPFGAEFSGLCRRDRLSLSYAPTDVAPRPEEQPLRSYSVESQPLFHITEPPKEVAGARDNLVWAESCANLDRRDDIVWFPASDARQAAEAAHWLLAVVQQVRAGRLHAASCNRFPNTKVSCENLVLQLAKLADIVSVESCAATAGSKCLVIDIGELTTITVVAHAATDGLDPSDIVSIAVSQYIVVT